MRGENANEDVLDESGEYRNTFVSFGCPPNSGVDARSTIAVEYFAKLKQFADPFDGSVILPGEFQTWQPGSPISPGEHRALY